MNTLELERIFAARGWLSRQSQIFRQRFVKMGRLVGLDRGAPAFHMGDREGGVFGVVSGGISVLGGTEWQMPALAHIERAGDWFGHGPALGGGDRILTFIAAEPTTLLHVPLEPLRQQMREDTEFAVRLAQMADFSTATVIWMARDLLIPDSSRRLAAVLLRVTAMGEAEPGNRDGYMMTQTELGEMANASRNQVNRVLGTLRRAGLVAVGYNRIRLLDVEALKAFAYAEN
jgi:CRP-like cAMP-binding protein